MESIRRGCVLEINVQSCKDPKAFNFFQKLSVYALVSVQLVSINDHPPDHKKLVDDDQQTKYCQWQRQVERQMNRTPTDGEGDGNPEWNHEIRFEFEFVLKDWDGLFIHFDLRHEGVGLLGIGDRSIGEIRVPLKDLILNLNNNNNNNRVMEDEHDSEILVQQQHQEAKYVKYQVTTSDGKPNGTLNFSYKLIKLYNIKGTGPTGGNDHDQPPVQYSTIAVLQEDDDDGSIYSNSTSSAYHNKKFNFNTTQVCYPAARAQSQTPLQESFSQLFRQEYSSSTPAASSDSSSQSEILQLQVADHHPICCWPPQYHHDHDHHKYHCNYHPPPPVLSAADHAYYPPPPPPPPPPQPPPPPPPPPMADHGASNHLTNYYLPPPPGHGMVHPWPSHPNYRDYRPWSPANIGPRQPPRHGQGHGF